MYGAGHNALGAWLHLASSGELRLDGDDTTFTQHIGDDVLPVHVPRIPRRARSSSRWTSRRRCSARWSTDRAELAAALGLREDYLVADRPAQVVDTGAGHLPS